MAVLKCEICGGKLIGKPGGIFECDSCGMEYSTEWAKQKIQEIRGTVQVEGTVEVQGTVKIDGPVQVEGSINAESLLKRGEMALEDQKWDEAADFFNQVLNYDAESCRAYLGLARADLHCATLDALKDTYLTWPDNCKTNRNFQRAMQFSDAELSTLISGWDSERPTWLEQKRQTIAQIRSRIRTPKNMICTGHDMIVGLYKDGSVTAAGTNSFGQCDVGGWSDIVAIASSGQHTVGLKADGTVVAVGDNKYGQCEVSDWRNIIAVSAGYQNTVGLKKDGTVVISGDNEYGQCNVWDWTEIIEVSICYRHTVGLRSDGTVVAAGSNEHGCCDVSGWGDIVEVSAGPSRTVGLRADGTVVAVGDNQSGQCNVSQWRDIIAVSAGAYTVGLKRDGTGVFTGPVRVGLTDGTVIELVDPFGGNKNIVAISTGGIQIAGLKSDGSVIIACTNMVPPKWNLFNRSMEILEAEKASLMAELPTLGGPFSGGRRKRVEARLAEIETELKKL